MEAKQVANEILTLIEISEETGMNIEFDDLKHEFDTLFKYCSEEMTKKVENVIYHNNELLESAYDELKMLFKRL